jgi:hypothetical protein
MSLPIPDFEMVIWQVFLWLREKIERGVSGFGGGCDKRLEWRVSRMELDMWRPQGNERDRVFVTECG